MHIHGLGPTFVQDLQQFIPVDGLVDRLPHFDIRPRQLGIQFPRRPTVFGVAPGGLVFGAEVQTTKIDLDLLRRAAAADELVALCH